MELSLQLTQSPPVRLHFDERAGQLHPSRFLASMVRRVLAATPVNRHQKARQLLKNGA